MKNIFKRSLALVLSVMLIAGLLCTGVSAADDRPVRVELDGKAVAFPDAEPTIVDGRTYVPFRAVFEALGAEVDFDAATRTVSASRNGTTVLIPIGSSELTVQQGGVSYSKYMDAAAYIEGGRTYIPVRYAAEALGCSVGWDADDRTVILVDTESMVNDAVENGKFTLVGKLMDYSEKLNKGNYEVKMKMDLACTVLAAKVLTASYDVSGIVAGNTAGEMSMDIKMDMGGLVDLLAKLSGEDEAQAKKELTEALAEEGFTDTKMEVTAQARVDMEKGAMYMSMSGIPGMEALLPADTWLYIDINGLLGELDSYGVNPLELSESVSPQQVIVLLINEMGYIYDKDSAYSEVKAQVDAILDAFADSAFVKNGQSYTNTQKIDELGLTLTLRLDTNSAGEVAGYELGADMAVSLEEIGLDESDLAELGEQLGVSVNADELKLTLRTGMDAKNRQTLKMELSMGNILLMTVNADGSYTPATRAPDTGLPAGAKSVSLEQWIESIYGF
ncbi:MAG: copper amine oxidase N-terminal domain-containing protein [Butyricicoccus sp.]|nr:copper amine oxidase N-terminal domain-containing protein [Butyricicoccus sp.]